MVVFSLIGFGLMLVLVALMSFVGVIFFFVGVITMDFEVNLTANLLKMKVSVQVVFQSQNPFLTLI